MRQRMTWHKLFDTTFALACVAALLAGTLAFHVFP
jgi:hypothetical protein